MPPQDNGRTIHPAGCTSRNPSLLFCTYFFLTPLSSRSPVSNYYFISTATTLLGSCKSLLTASHTHTHSPPNEIPQCSQKASQHTRHINSLLLQALKSPSISVWTFPQILRTAHKNPMLSGLPSSSLIPTYITPSSSLSNHTSPFRSSRVKLIPAQSPHSCFLLCPPVFLPMPLQPLDLSRIFSP